MDRAHFHFDAVHSQDSIRELTPDEEGSTIQDVLGGLAITAFIFGVMLFAMVLA